MGFKAKIRCLLKHGICFSSFELSSGELTKINIFFKLVFTTVTPNAIDDVHFIQVFCAHTHTHTPHAFVRIIEFARRMLQQTPAATGCGEGSGLKAILEEANLI